MGQCQFGAGDTNSGNGLIYGFKDWDNYYYFQITPNGYYRIGAVNEGLNLEFVEWTASKYINKDHSRNLIKVSKINEKVFFSINREIIEVRDFYGFSGNLVGFFTLAADKQLYYEKLEVRQHVDETAILPNTSAGSEWKGSGSGVFIDHRGYVATNFHVVKGASHIEIAFVRAGQKLAYSAKVISSDSQNDLSVLKIDDPRFRPFANLPYSVSTSTADVGTEVFALGYPVTVLLGDELKFTDGKISSKTGFQGDVSTYQISVPVQPGNSGGPLFDYKGNLIGIVSSKVPILENVSYAIKTSYLTNLVDTLPEKLVIPRQNLIVTKPLTEKIKAISDYVVLLRVR